MGRKLQRLFEKLPDLSPVLFLAITVILLFPLQAYCQTGNQDPVTDLNHAMSTYDDQKYEEAYTEFTALAEKYPQDSHNSIFRFMAAKSLYMDGDYQRADSLWDEFVKTFPGSSYLQEALLFKGNCLYKEGYFPEAADSYLSSIEIKPGTEVSLLARDNLMPLAQRGLTIEQLKRLINDHEISPATESVEYILGKRYSDTGHYRKAASALQAFMRHHPGSHDFKQARTLMLEAQRKAESRISIGLLAPISGSYVEFGRSMIEGARLALNQYKSNGIQIDLNIKDTGSDPIQAAESAGEMADEEPLAVVGPLYSSAAISAAIVLNQNEIPMITPTASESGLAGIGSFIFQISPSVERIGAEMGRYAVENLDIHEFAIIAPDDADGIKISNAFAEAVYGHGGEVISTTYYPSGATDFKTQIMPLHEILAARIEEQLAEGLIDSAEYINPKNHELLDKEDWPVYLGGLFLPGYGEELKMLIPQVRYHVIRTRFLGSYSWDSSQLIREVRPYVDGAVYASDFHIQPGDSTWSSFANAYQVSFGHPPEKVAAATFDAVSMIMEGINAGDNDPVRLRDYLSQIRNYRGISTVVTFKGTGRANDEVGIYSIDDNMPSGSR